MDEIRLNLNEDSFVLLNILIAYIMFGVSLNLKREDFILLFKKPKLVTVGLSSQFLLLPALTFLLIILLKPSPLIGLGMVLVAACPGGPVSNFFVDQARGNTALSISLTAISTVLAVFLTPLNYELWGNMIPGNDVSGQFSISFLDMFKTLITIVGIPVISGIVIGNRFPGFVVRSEKVIRISSVIILFVFVGGALYANAGYFRDYIGLVIGFVILHNAVALTGGYFWARIFGFDHTQRKTVGLETAIQNSALALIIIFTFFDANGPMSMVAATWGVWHLIVGFILSQIWRKKDRNKS